MRNVTDHSVIVGCLPGYNGGLKQKFVLTLQELTAEQLTSTHQHLINKHLMDQNKYPSILTTEELEDFNNNEISSVHSHKSVIVDKLDSNSNKLEKSSRKRAKSSFASKSSSMINLLEDKTELDDERSSKEFDDNSDLSQNNLNDQNIDLEPGGSLNLTSDRAQFFVKGLHSGSTYLFTLHAINSRGISKAVVLVAQTLAAPESMNRMGDGEFHFC